MTPLPPCAATAHSSPPGSYIYCDGAGSWASPRPFAPGVGLDRSHKLLLAKHQTLAALQVKLDARGFGQGLVLNGMDVEETAVEFVRTGAPAAMFDHWSILQFLNRTTGAFNVSEVEAGFDMVRSPLLHNFTTQIKGWVGPVIKQRGVYPAGMPQMNTTAKKVKAIAERFNSELALFLLVAKETDFWIYSWFWDWYDYVGGNAESTIPADFFPEAKCALGAPAGPMERIAAGAATFRRKFAHADVFVNLDDRQASKVTFADCK